MLCALLADGRPLDGRYLLGILSGVLLGVLFAFFSARYSSKRLTAPLEGLDPAAGGKAENVEEAPYRELAPLTEHIRTQNEKLTQQMRDLRARA